MLSQEGAALQQIKDKLNKLYGQGTIMSASEKPAKVEVISTGSLLIDLATGIGGFPLGRIVEIIAPESAGKTTICLQTVAEAQKMDIKPLYIDMEHALDMNYAAALGVNTEQMMISQPGNGEQALNIAKTVTESGLVKLIIIDSVSSLVPKKEIEGEVGDSNIGRQAWMMSQALRILAPLAEKAGVLIIFTNQFRMKVGTMYGSPETGSGGEALKYYASVRVDMRRQVDKENEGNKTRVRIVKNKLAVPFKEANVFIEWGKGISRMQEVINLAVEFGIIKKAGSWYSYDSTRIGQGEETVKTFLSDNEGLYEEISRRVLGAMTTGTQSVAV